MITCTQLVLVIYGPVVFFSYMLTVLTFLESAR